MENEKDRYLVFSELAEGSRFIPAPIKEAVADDVGFKYGAYTFMKIRIEDPDLKYNAISLNDGRVEKIPNDLPVLLLL